VPLRKEIKDNLTREGMQNIRGLHRLLDALLKNLVALKVLVWSRGRLVALQTLTYSFFSLMEETHGSSGQCVSFSLLDQGVFSLPMYMVSISFLSSTEKADLVKNEFCFLREHTNKS